MALHAHAEPRLVVVLSGRFHERYARATRVGTPGSAIYRPAGEVHGENFISERGAYVSIAMPEAWFEGSGLAEQRHVRGRSARSERIAAIGRLLSSEVYVPIAGRRLRCTG